MSAPARSPNSPPDIASLITAQGGELSTKLQKHRLDLFPPDARKPLRQFQPNEVARILGLNPGYLRNLSLEGKGPVATTTPSGRRSYSAEQILELRQYLDENTRAGRRYLPHRRLGEKVQIVAVANFKGGSGKTTTAAHLVQHLALAGHRVLAIDLDPQASLSAIHGMQPEFDVGDNESLYGAIRYDAHRRPMKEIIRQTNFPGLDIIPANLELTEFEYDTPRALAKGEGGMTAHKFYSSFNQAIDQVADQYDIVVFDSAPTLNYLTMAALCAATGLLITVHPQMLDIMSMCQFLIMLGNTMTDLRDNGAALQYDWVRYLITRYDPQDGPQIDMTTFIRSHFGRHVVANPMLKSTAISDAALTKQTLYEVDRRQMTSSTYDRAMESLTAVNVEIETLIHRTWGRA